MTTDTFDDFENPRNDSLTVVLDGYFVDALEEYLLKTAHCSRVTAGLADEEYFGQARTVMNTHGENLASRLASRLAWMVRDLPQAGPLANAIEAADAASTEYRNSDRYVAFIRSLPRTDQLALESTTTDDQPK